MIDESNWRRLVDPGQVEKAAKEALRQLGREASFISGELVVPRHPRATHAECDELWCVKIKESANDIRECLAVNEGHDDMVKKFVRAFRSVFAQE